MPLTNWGALDANRYQQQRSQGRGWGNQSYRGYPRQQPGGYQQPPLPYSGAGAWQQGGGRGQWPPQQSSQPQRGYRAGGGIGGLGGGMGQIRSPGAVSYEQGQQNRMQQLMDWYNPLQKMFGQDPRFQQSWEHAAGSMFDPLYKGSFRPWDMFMKPFSGIGLPPGMQESNY